MLAPPEFYRPRPPSRLTHGEVTDAIAATLVAFVIVMLAVTILPALTAL